MSKILLIRHLPSGLSFSDKERLLKHFGAENVWETSSKRNYLFASFNSVELAKSSLTRLHQLELSGRKLVVEFSSEREPLKCKKIESDQNSIKTRHVKEFLRILNAWSPSVDFYQPPPINLKYSYPDITANIIINIVHSVYSHKPLYTQILHLMNKMCLELPFKEDTSAIEFFKEKFKHLFIEELQTIPQPISEDESEISSDEQEVQKESTATVIKRKHSLPLTRKRPAAILSTALLPRAKKSNVSQEDVFEVTTPIHEPKKISLVVTQDALQKPAESVEITGELGTFEIEKVSKEKEEKYVEIEQPPISRKELLRNRISYRDMKLLPVFKNYHPGQPSMRLYIKNLAKSVTEQDVKRIFKHYVEELSEDEQVGFDVRVMQEGRMKGQAFVTFPSVNIAEKAVNETNGFMLKERPMVVQFARVANKTIS